MRIVKEVRTTHPTVQYGNIDLMSRYEFDSETDQVLIEDTALLKELDAVITRRVVKSWANLHDYVEEKICDKIGRMHLDDKKEKDNKPKKGFNKTYAQKERRRNALSRG